MDIRKIKVKILGWKDFYGGGILDVEKASQARTKKATATDFK